MEYRFKRFGWDWTPLNAALIASAAVLVVMLAIFIPITANLSNKTSSGTEIAQQLNAALASAEEGGTNATTMSQALDVVSDAGYGIKVVSATYDGNALAWQQDSNRFVLVSQSGKVLYKDSATTTTAATSLWKVASSSEDVTGSYSYYLNYTASAVASGAGIDVGENEDVNITYSGTEKATIMFVTNGGTLSIDNENATVIHYGSAENVVITAVAANSYHEHGAVSGLIQVAQGRVVIEQDATVSNVFVTATETGKVSLENSSSNSITVGATSSEVASDVTSGSKNLTTTLLFDGGNGSEQNPYQIATVSQWQNLTKSEYQAVLSGGNHFKVTADLDFTSEEDFSLTGFNGYMDFGNCTITLADTCLFNAIYGGDTVISNATLLLTGEGNLSLFLYLNEGNITFSNITTTGNYYMTDNNTTPFCWGVFGYGNDYCLTFENCSNTANITATGSSSAGIFLGKVFEGDTVVAGKSYDLIDLPDGVTSYGSAKVVFDTCTNYGTLLHAKGYSSMLIANSCTFAHNTLSDFTVTSCANYGAIYGADEANLLCGSGWSTNVTLEDIENYIATINAENNLVNGSTDTTTGVCTTATLGTLSVKTDSTAFDLDSITASSYSVIYTFWVTMYENAEDATSYGWGSYSIIISANSLESLPAYSWISSTDLPEGATTSTVAIGDTTLTTYTTDEATYFVFNYDYISSWTTVACEKVTISNVTLALYAYEDGSVTGIYTYNY